MIVDSPIWNMKIICPCCEQGNPVFVVCPNCGFLTVECDELLNYYADPKDLNKGFIKHCPKCNYDTNDFVIATNEQILAAGFTKEDYE